MDADKMTKTPVITADTTQAQVSAQAPANTDSKNEPAPRRAPKHMQYVLEAQKILDAKKSTPAAAPDDAGVQPLPPSAIKRKESEDNKNGQAPLKTNTASAASTQAPQNWTAETKEAFSKLPTEGKDIVLKIYKDLLHGWNKKMRTVDMQRGEVEKVISTVAPFTRGRFKNLDEFAGYLQSVQRFEKQMQTNPMRTLAVLAQTAGIELSDLANFQPDPASEMVMPLQDKMDRIEAMLAQRLQPQQQPATPAQPPQSDFDAMIEEFANAKGADGKLLHPHFDAVKNMMGEIMLRDGHEDMETAYKAAILTLPQVAQERQAAAEAAAKAQAQKEADLAKARKAAALHTRSTAGQFVPTTHKKKRPLDYILEAERVLGEK